MNEYITRNVSISPMAANNGLYDAVLSVQEDIGDGFPVRIRRLGLTKYQNHGAVLLNHEFSGVSLPVGRTESIGVDNQDRLVAQFRFLENDELADRVRNAWDQGIMRSASITVRNFAAGEQELIEWSIVSLPADVEAVARSVSMAEKKSDVELSDGAKVYEKVEAKAEAGGNDQLQELIARMAKLEETMAGLQKDIESKTEEANDATQRADAVESKVSLLHAFGELLPDDTSVRSMSEHDILVSVVGDTVPDATSRSTGYLMAKAEGILAERQAAKKAIAEVKPEAVSKRAIGNVTDIMFETILEDKK